MRGAINRFWAHALVVFAAHNAEESIAIANGWTARHWREMSWTAQKWPLFASAAAALTLFVALIAWNLRRRPERSARGLRVFLSIMLLNACWHVGVSVYTRSLAPGVVTAVLLIFPIFTILLFRLPRAGLDT